MNYLKKNLLQSNQQLSQNLLNVKKMYFIFLFINLFNFSAFAQNAVKTQHNKKGEKTVVKTLDNASDHLIYSRILLEANNSKELFKTLADNDLYVDHAARTKGGQVVVFNNHEIEQLKDMGISFRILVEDLEKAHLERLAKELKKPEIKRRLSSKKTGFDLGSQAGYNTPDELNAKLDEISNTYPNIAAEKVAIGKTYEGRDIFYAKNFRQSKYR